MRPRSHVPVHRHPADFLTFADLIDDLQMGFLTFSNVSLRPLCLCFSFLHLNVRSNNIFPLLPSCAVFRCKNNILPLVVADLIYKIIRPFDSVEDYRKGQNSDFLNLL